MLCALMVSRKRLLILEANRGVPVKRLVALATMGHCKRSAVLPLRRRWQQHKAQVNESSLFFFFFCFFFLTNRPLRGMSRFPKAATSQIPDLNSIRSSHYLSSTENQEYALSWEMKAPRAALPTAQFQTKTKNGKKATSNEPERCTIPKCCRTLQICYSQMNCCDLFTKTP